MTCKHDRYDLAPYYPHAVAWAHFCDTTSPVCYISARVTHCATCGADISERQIHRIATTKEYLRGLDVKQ